MFVHFHLHFRTVFGRQIGIEFRNSKDINNKIIIFQTYDGENWTGILDLKSNDAFEYNYAVFQEEKIIEKEWGKSRQLHVRQSSNIFIEDKWRSRSDENNAFFSTAFTQAIFRRNDSIGNIPSKKTVKSGNFITFKLHAANIQPHLKFGITGSSSELGSWKQVLMMDETNYPTWEVTVPIQGNEMNIAYKFVVIDPADGRVLIWEHGNDRTYSHHFIGNSQNQVVITDENFRYNDARWKGSGVAIPVFSLRSKAGLGIGEFSDLKLLADWTSSINMNFIQVLPVNDTIANKTWVDSYPYAAISVFALHPLYINIQNIAGFKKKSDKQDFVKDQEKLNSYQTVDFEQVLETKFKYLRILFDQEYNSFKNDPEAISFIDRNKDWVLPYAVFCHLRDKFGSCNYSLWPSYRVYSPDVTKELCDDSYQGIKEVEFYYFIQYHADKQLHEAKEYARSKGVVLKGDLPIGIYRYSCDAWVAPELYNMDEQAGAPPDDYAVLGQNWGFPTYNWEVMAKDGFKWWRKRMQQLNMYFDALRIDHILGFFRIWQIPADQIEGTMGLFNPRLPFSRDEIAAYGITGDLSYFSTPYMNRSILESIFGNNLEDIFDIFFNEGANSRITFKSSFVRQREISTFIAQNPKFAKFEKDLLHLLTEVLLIEEPGSNGQLYNPRITLSTTNFYSQLDQNVKFRFDNLYNDYYFRRHDEYWKQQALWKLPAILDASDMLICGEDLGMIPKSVPGVMKDLNIISLEIQRMPKGNTKFGAVASYPYFSVCSPSCHDMSTIRGWWEADHNNAKDYYYNYLKWYGLTPMECSPDIVQAIVEDHLASPSMLAIFPIQDLVALDEELRNPVASSEQINEPSNPKHYWRFRFHICLEDLLKVDQLNSKLRFMVDKNGRAK